MNCGEIIQELKNKSNELNKSHGRRDFSRSFYNKCVKKFGSFNNAKLKSGLKMYRRTCDPLPKKSIKLDKDLAKLISFF